MEKVYIGIGSNIDKHIHIPQVLEELAEKFGQLQVSPIYETASEGFSGDDFHNLVVGLAFTYPVQILLNMLLS